jgi:hypothetical protein
VDLQFSPGNRSSGRASSDPLCVRTGGPPDSFSLEIGPTATPRSQKRDLGHPLNIRPRHFHLLSWAEGPWKLRSKTSTHRRGDRGHTGIIDAGFLGLPLSWSEFAHGRRPGITWYASACRCWYFAATDGNWRSGSGRQEAHTPRHGQI